MFRQANVFFAAALALCVTCSNAGQMMFGDNGSWSSSGEEGAKRPSLHLSIVIDCSLQDGQSLERSLRMAVDTISRLTEEDTVSIVSYGDSATLVLPATSAANRAVVLEKLRELKPIGMKALFAGMARGAEELRRKSSENQLKKILVLAGTGTGALIGPDTKQDIRTLVESLRKEKISVSAPYGLRGSGAGSGGRPVFNITRGEDEDSSQHEESN